VTQSSQRVGGGFPARVHHPVAPSHDHQPSPFLAAPLIAAPAEEEAVAESAEEPQPAADEEAPAEAPAEEEAAAPAAAEEAPAEEAAVEEPAALAPEGGEGAAVEEVAGPGVCEIVFVIMPEGFTHEASFPETVTVEQVKQELQGDLEIRPEHITLRFSGTTLANSVTLQEAGVPTSGALATPPSCAPAACVRTASGGHGGGHGGGLFPAVSEGPFSLCFSTVIAVRP